ncbi:glycoside hydrolase family 31 protein [Streptomyces sp. H10-C2]|uniref:TIM-barrel domain-containing protein n=1 Tax=unclassified Streptomyces TaxID=2593676 RepID=UPI0024B92FC0|nr:MULTISPECIES: TIM-barrel domain-containing protein [unclassified Streptomyces]MDJ0346599.1 glycoside hydrolase family 31 protein [Streptomyces sp. PH10-H1]MDJ0375028.1 glycoside hydrolase family 31 protein [Streptomyces sp. H10-C2]
MNFVRAILRARALRWSTAILLVVTAGFFIVSDSARGWCSTTSQDQHAHGPVAAAGTFAPGVSAADIASTDGGAQTLHLRWPLAADEHLFGLGERFGPLDLVGQAVDTWAGTTPQGMTSTANYSPTPFLLSSRGYGLLLDTPARAHWDVGATHPGCLTVDVAASHVRVYTLHGPTPAAVLAQHAAVVGRPPLPPPWGLGVWKNLIGGSDRVREDLARLDTAGIPADAVWIYDAVDEESGFGYPWHIYGPIPPGLYPDLPGLVADLHRRGLKVLGYLNPFVLQGTAAWSYAQGAGFLVSDHSGRPITGSLMGETSSLVDLTNPGAARWFGDRVERALRVVGFDGAMQDFGEDAPVDGVYASGVPGALVHNEYPVLYGRIVREAAQRVKPDATVFLTRSGYDGSQQYATARWPCDQTRSWERNTGLPSVVPAMLSGGISGWPYWGPDIAGFFDQAAVPTERELWIRWLELGALSPIMRDMLGAGSAPVGLWTDDETLRTFRTYAQLHEDLVPYLNDLAADAHTQGLPLARPLFLDYPDDAAAYRIGDEYLLGPDVLVAPVTQPGQRERSVYVPAGRWCDHWTGAEHTGPALVSVPAPVDHIPLLMRDRTPHQPGACPLPSGRSSSR